MEMRSGGSGRDRLEAAEIPEFPQPFGAGIIFLILAHSVYKM